MILQYHTVPFEIFFNSPRLPLVLSSLVKNCSLEIVSLCALAIYFCGKQQIPHSGLLSNVVEDVMVQPYVLGWAKETEVGCRARCWVIGIGAVALGSILTIHFMDCIAGKEHHC